MSTTLVVARGVRKSYDDRAVLRDVTLTLDGGECVTLLGANGSGKTTLLRLLAALARPTAGSLTVMGRDVVRDANAVRRMVGYVGHQPTLYADLTVAENLAFYAAMYGVSDGMHRGHALLDRVGLGGQTSVRGRTLSRGQAQRFSLARALLHGPRVLLLDEPETGLDGAARDMLRSLIAEHSAAGGCALVATHMPEQLVAVTTRTITLRGGRLALPGDLPSAASLSVTGGRN
jgi:heme ABC exporter ATP-binding subunit CcmA